MLWETKDLPRDTKHKMTHRTASVSWRTGVVALWVLSILLAQATTIAAAADPVDRIEADRTFQAALESLAVKCDKLGLPAQEKLSRTWFIRRDPRRYYLFLPPETGLTKPAADAPRLVKLWHARFVQLRKEQAERLFTLAQQQLKAGDEGAAYRLVHEVLHEDPDHARARHVLGYSKSERGWRHAARRPSRRRNRGSHPQFGWASNKYWRVDSEHFELTTNASARAGQQVATYLERVHTAWQQLFYPYWTVPGRLAARFQGEDRSLGPDRVFAVVLFSDRNEYMQQLSRSEPRIGMSVGYYSQNHKTAFFYAGDDAARTTWVHESTHQFFQESGTVAPQVGERENFWVVEGVALYMESLLDHGAYATTGGVDADRLQFARFRKLSQGYYVPLDQLVGYGREQMQKDANIRQLYSQSAGLTHFLIHGNEGRWMRPFVDYVMTVYRGVGQHQTLQARIGQPYAQLDQSYPGFLNVTDADMAFVDPGARSLCLGHTEVTDAGLAKVPGCSELRWLDLSFTSATNDGVTHFASAHHLDQLNLEKTAITDAALDTVAHFAQLHELDLSQTAVTDRGLSKLSRLAHLQILWLTGTQVTDQGLAALTSLRDLEQLNVRSTRVTAAAIKQLRKRLPKLK